MVSNQIAPLQQFAIIHLESFTVGSDETGIRDNLECATQIKKAEPPLTLPSFSCLSL
jgi:hypothetical protein